MNKSELIEAVAADTGLTKTDSALVLESVLGTVTKTLKKGDDVIITGFGKFSVVQRAARQGVNPRTGERVKIKASKAPKFSAGATLKQAVSGKKKYRGIHVASRGIRGRSERVVLQPSRRNHAQAIGSRRKTWSL